MASLYHGSKASFAHSILSFLLAALHWLTRSSRMYNLRRSIQTPPTGQTVQNALAEVYGGPITKSSSVFLHLEQGLRRNPHSLAVICLHQPADHLSDILLPAKRQRWLTDGNIEEEPTDDLGRFLTITYHELHQTAQKLAAGLQSASVKPNSKLLMLIPNGGEYALLTWCCIILRITYVCVDPEIMNVSGYRGLRDVMRTVRPSLIVTAGVMQATAVDIAIEDLALSLPIRISLGGRMLKGWRSLSDLISSSARIDLAKLLDAARKDSPDRINSIIFTSGTSGTPKGCPLRVSNICHILESQSWLVNEDNSARALQAAHNSRGIALFQTLQTWKAGGSVMMIENSCDIKEMTEALRHHSPTFIAVSPAMASAIQEEMSDDLFGADSVKTVQVGGDTVTMGTLAECAAFFPQAKICVNHGMTEGGGSFNWPFFDTPLIRIPRFGELCPIGTVAPGSIIRIWDPTSRRVVKRGEVGELHICGGSLLRQYIGGRMATSFYDDKDGRWFITGDTAMIDRDGIVFILGRSKEMIVCGGDVVVPAAIETVLYKFIGFQAAVIPVKHPTLGHAPFAVVKELAGRTERHISKHVTAILGKGYVLAGVVSLKQAGLVEFPRNGSGKVSKAEIAMAVQKIR